MKMIAHYDDYNEDFRVDLWEESKGFILHLDHEYVTFWIPCPAILSRVSANSPEVVPRTR
jgi:hypothetical protein